MGAWYQKADSAVPKPKERTQRGSGQREFWLKKGQEKQIIFVDDVLFSFYQHNLKIDGDWGYLRTCCRGVEGYPSCPYCEYSGLLAEKAVAEARKAGRDITMPDGGKYPAYFVGYLTIIDTSEWTDREGKIHINERKLFSVKMKMANQLMHIKGHLKGVSGRLFVVRRSEERNAPRTGDSFIFLNQVDMADHDNPKPLNYIEIFKPAPYDVGKKEVDGLLSTLTAVESIEEQTAEPMRFVDEDIPF